MAERAEIDEVRLRTDIVAVVEQYVSLKRAGGRYRGLCPFHNEKTPSFHVNPDAGYWHCFGCSEGGDVINFVQKIENLSFGEALERLALKAGVTLTQRSTRDRHEAGQPSERERQMAVNTVALKYFQESFGHSKDAQAYAAERGFDAKTVADFSIGYAPETWDGLAIAIRRANASLPDAEAVGLVSRGTRGEYHDRMRGRLVFPIFDVQERPIAFGGRLIVAAKDGQQLPKYWNSPESAVFQKRTALYGIWRARAAIKESGYAILMEGYTDVIAAHRNGYENAMAGLGTALTEEHVKVLRRLTSRVLLAYDGDGAGLKAAFRASDLFEANDIEIGLLDLPDGEDPDSMLRAGRRAEFDERINAAVPMVEYRIGRLVAEARQRNIDGVKLFNKLVPILATVRSVVERDRYIRMVANHHPDWDRGAKLAEEQIRQDIVAHMARHPEHRGVTDIVTHTPPVGRDAVEVAEREIIRALASSDDKLAKHVAERLEIATFSAGPSRSLAEALVARRRGGEPLPEGPVANWLGDDALSHLLGEILMVGDQPTSAKAVDDAMAHLTAKAGEKEFAELKSRICAADVTAEELRRWGELARRLKGSAQMSANEA